MARFGDPAGPPADDGRNRAARATVSVPMRHITLVLALVVAACGSGDTATTTTTTTTADPPVTIDESLDVDVGDRLSPGFSVGIWRAGRDGSHITVSKWQLYGDEAGRETVIVFDAGDGATRFVAATTIDRPAGDEPRAMPIPVTRVELTSFDPDRVIAGRLHLADGELLDFWADARPESIVDPEIGEEFLMVPGAVLDGFTYAVQYLGVVQDSRCPPDVTCIQAGTLELEFSFVDESGATTVVTSGVATPQGPMFGTDPAIDLPGSRFIEVLDATEADATLAMRTADEG